MDMNRKGQSALEFLMTYGWAILVVLAAIGALAYFGVLNPSNFLPDQCTASTGFGCVGKPVVSATNVSFVLTNGAGSDITFSNENLTLTSSAGTTCTAGHVFFCDRGTALSNVSGVCDDTVKTVGDGQDFIVYLACPTTGTVHKAVLKFAYTNQLSGLPDEMTIQVSGKRK